MESEQGVFDLPAISDEMRQEVATAIGDFEASMGPAEPAEVSRMLGKLALLFPNGKLSQDEARAQNLLYAEMLADIPADLLGEAFRKAAQTCRFYPTVSEIRTCARHGLAMRSWRLMRLKGIALKHDREAR